MKNTILLLAILLVVPAYMQAQFVTDSSYRYQWDANTQSFKSEPFTKVIYEYNASNQVLSSLNSIWNSGIWTPNFRLTNTYHPNGKLATQKRENWVNNAWENVNLTTNTYVGNNNTETLQQYWENNAWVDASLTTRTFDASDRILTSETKTRVGGVLTNNSRFSMTYPANQEIRVDETWQSGAWVETGRTTTTFNANQLPTTVLVESKIGGNWVSSSRTTNTYNASQNLTLRLLEYWINNAWNNSTRTVNTYNTIGKVDTSRFDMWSNGNWQQTDRTIYVYNQDAREVNRRLQVFENNTWRNFTETTQNYDGNGNIEYIAFKQFAPNGSVNVSVSDSTRHYYRLSPVGIASFQNDFSFQIFPNPASDFINIRMQDAIITSIAVFDVSGKLVTEMKPLNDANCFLSTESFGTGIYIVNAFTDKGLLRRNFIKQ